MSCGSVFDDFVRLVVKGFIQKDSVTHLHDLAVYGKEGYPFAYSLSLEKMDNIFFPLAFPHLLTYLFSLYHPQLSSLLTILILFRGYFIQSFCELFVSGNF